MRDINSNKHGTQMTDLSVIIGRFNSNNDGGADGHPVNVDLSNFRHTEKDCWYNTSNYWSNYTSTGEKRK